MTPHITKLHIDAFRGLRDVTLHDIGGVTLVFGPNNVGKTSVLEAISLASRPLDTQHWLRVARGRCLGWMSITSSDAVKSLFPGSGQEPDALYSGTLGFRVWASSAPGDVRVTARFVEGERVVPDPVRKGQLQIFDDTERFASLTVSATDLDANPIFPELGDLVEEVAAEIGSGSTTISRGKLGRRRVEYVRSADHYDERAIATRLNQALKAGYRVDLVRLLQKLDPRITDIEVLSNQNQRAAMYLRHTHAGVLPLSAFGDGVRRLALLSIAVNVARDGILVVDEIDTALHHSVLGDVFGWLVSACRDSNTQLVASSHNIEAIDACVHATRQMDIETTGIRLSTDDKQAVRATTLSHQQLVRLRMERGWEIR